VRWNRIRLFLLFVAVFASSVFGQAGSHQESAKSVVKITSRFAGGKVEVGTGFVWSQPDYIVTALHVVAGATSIAVYSEALKKEREADVINVHQESDLALLKLKTNDLALVPLKISSAPPNSDDRHYIWGYPRDVNTMQGDGVYFSSSLNQQATMGSIFKSAAHFESVVGKQGYPQYQAKILRVSDIIAPGHSGAPIFNKSGTVVGVGDGGLHQGIARINWAIPAHVYIASLPASKDVKPTEASKQTNLYSAHVEQPVEVKSAPRKVKTKEGKVRTVKAQSLHLVWTASVAEALALVSAEDLKALQKISAEVKQKNAGDLQKELLDVYEDYSIGATVAVPHGLKLSYSATDRMFETWSPSKRVGMFIRFDKNKTRKAGKQAMASYERGVRQAPAQIPALKSAFGATTGGKAAKQWEDAPAEPSWVEEEAFPENWEEQVDPEMTFAEDEEEALAEEPSAEDDEEAEEEEPPAEDEEAEEEPPAEDEEEEEPPYAFTGKRGGPFMLPPLFEGPRSHSVAPPAASQKDFRTETFKILKDKKGEKQAEMFTSFVFDGPNFLGTSVLVHGFKTLSPEDWKAYYMMVLCSKLAAFSVE
jgi:S1-C subfamily serine protease